MFAGKVASCSNQETYSDLRTSSKFENSEFLLKCNISKQNKTQSIVIDQPLYEHKLQVKALLISEINQ